jgi:UDP-glucose 4-epimerase
MERLALLYHQLHNIQIIALRLFSVYGPNETYKKNYANCLTQFLWGMMKGESPVIYGDGEQTRDLTHVDDVVRAFIIASQADPKYGIFNVGTGVETSYNQLVYKLNKALDTNISPEYVPMPIKNYVYKTCAYTYNATKILGFRTQIPLDDGLRRMVEAYRDKI